MSKELPNEMIEFRYVCNGSLEVKEVQDEIV